VNEVLCVLSNNFGRLPRDTLASAFAEFYTEEEIGAAKKCLIDIAESLNPKVDELKRIKPRQGDGKLRRDTDDVLLLYTVLDSKKCSFPRFLAADSNRIISMKEFDACNVHARISELSSNVAELSSSIAKVVDSSSTVESLITEIQSINQQLKSSQIDPTPAELAGRVTGDSSTAGSSPWRTVLANGKSVLTSLVPAAATVRSDPVRDASASSQRRKIVGAKSTASKIASSVSGEKSWHIFIGKLQKDTSESDLKEYLEDAGVSTIEIRKLKPANEYQEKSAAFRVSIALKCKDAVMNADLWPGNVVVRDWFFKPKSDV